MSMTFLMYKYYVYNILIHNNSYKIFEFILHCNSTMFINLYEN